MEDAMPISMGGAVPPTPLLALQAVLDAIERRKMESGIELTIVDQSDIVGKLASGVRVGELSMTSVKNMVATVLAARGAYPIRRLNILDHGNEASFQIGGDWISTYTFPTYSTELGRLTPAFHSKGFVHLQACKIGMNKELLGKLAALWSVPVYAGTGNQYAIPINAGEYVRVDPDGKSCPTGRPGVDAGCE
jgi:hypothetical protein